MTPKNKRTPQDLPEPTAAMKQAISNASERASRRLPSPQMKLGRSGTGITLSNPHSDGKGWDAHVKDAFGSLSDNFCDVQIETLLRCLSDVSGEIASEKELNAALAMFAAAKPQNEIEATLAAQMIATHSLAMKLLGRARRETGLPQFEAHSNAATKLLRTFVLQIEALAKLKRGGEQTVRVEHVHIHPGAQAIVGSINGGGGTPEKPGQPLALALPSPDPERRPMPVIASDGKEAVPHAWRGARQRRA
jgi:hypothetical protein